MTTNAREITYAFLNTYYQRMNADPLKIHHLYSATAELTHINYQCEFDDNLEVMPTIKITGKENISKFYARYAKKVKTLRVKIDSCDFQFTGANNTSILILTLGEMFWLGTPSYKFCQTFVLVPTATNPKIFDVCNDMIYFPPDRAEESQFSNVEQMKDTENLPEEEAMETESSGQAAGNEVNDSKVPEESSSALANGTYHKEAPASKLPETLEPPASEETPHETVQNAEMEDDEDVSNTMTHESASHAVEIATEEKPKKMNWASKIANSESKVVPNVATNYIRAEPESPQVGKKVNERKSTSPGGQPRDSKIFKKKVFYYVNKDGFYPVYVRGTGGVTDEQLVKALEKEFGIVRKISSQETFAVVDFEDQQCQTDAIERGVLRINNVDVHMEPKTVRKPTNTFASSSPSGQRFNKKHLNRKKN
ncbi:LAMI_0A00584g1_1 [Lachancea mirantina]|uniref:LAMI_0A00584g1_1 n=1 Tax=Lachancea mirantina TaxID=1230905 RepID=A0A1G4IL65_9SACH|nr:LAMI_0A00584g1_1 [Lachancea mirantina]